VERKARAPALYNRKRVGCSFFIQNFGCRATQADGAALEAALLARVTRLPSATRPVSSFSTLARLPARPMTNVRQTLRRIRRENPSRASWSPAVTPQRAPEEVAALPGVVWVVGNSHKARIPELLSGGASYHGQIQVGDIFAQREFLAGVVEDAAGRPHPPNLKIQDGCGNRCSFCIIPVRSRPQPQRPPGLGDRAAPPSQPALPRGGTHGINLGRWGRDLDGGRLRLAGLLRRLLAETDVERLRLSSVEPMDLSGDLLGLMAASPRIARHVHAPLQSGSDAVLRRMRRWYRARHYEDLIRQVRAAMRRPPSAPT